MAREDRARQSWSTMGDWRHPVEEMRRMSRTRLNCRDRRVEIRTRMPQRHDMARACERPYQIDPAGKLRRQRDDTDAAACAFDDVENLRPGERPRHGTAMLVRRPEAFERLCAAEVGVDEIALQVRRQHASGIRARRAGGGAHLFQKELQIVRAARHGGGTKGGDAVTRQLNGDPRDYASAVERVMTGDAVHVHVDEPGNDVAVGDVDDRRTRRRGWRRLNGRDAAVVEDDRRTLANLAGQYDVAAIEDDHAGRDFSARNARRTLPVDVHVELAPFQRQPFGSFDSFDSFDSFGSFGAENFLIEPLEQV